MIDVLAIIRDAIAHRYWLREAPEITSETDLNEIGCDQIDRVCIACDLDEALGIELPEAVVSGWVTAGDVEACVEGVGG